MAGGNAIRGSRIGAGPMGEAERGEAAPRNVVSYWCANGHEMTPSFSVDDGVEVRPGLRGRLAGHGGSRIHPAAEDRMVQGCHAN